MNMEILLLKFRAFLALVDNIPLIIGFKDC